MPTRENQFKCANNVGAPPYTVCTNSLTYCILSMPPEDKCMYICGPICPTATGQDCLSQVHQHMMDNSKLIWAVSDVPPSLSYSASLGRLSPSVYQHMQKRKHVHLSVRTRPCWSFYETWQLHSGTCCQGIHLLLIAANLTQSIVLLILQSIHQHYITHTTHSYFT